MKKAFQLFLQILRLNGRSHSRPRLISLLASFSLFLFFTLNSISQGDTFQEISNLFTTHNNADAIRAMAFSICSYLWIIALFIMQLAPEGGHVFLLTIFILPFLPSAGHEKSSDTFLIAPFGTQKWHFVSISLSHIVLLHLLHRFSPFQRSMLELVASHRRDKREREEKLIAASTPPKQPANASYLQSNNVTDSSDGRNVIARSSSWSDLQNLHSHAEPILSRSKSASDSPSSHSSSHKHDTLSVPPSPSSHSHNHNHAHNHNHNHNHNRVPRTHLHTHRHHHSHKGGVSIPGLMKKLNAKIRSISISSLSFLHMSLFAYLVFLLTTPSDQMHNVFLYIAISEIAHHAALVYGKGALPVITLLRRPPTYWLWFLFSFYSSGSSSSDILSLLIRFAAFCECVSRFIIELEFIFTRVPSFQSLSAKHASVQRISRLLPWIYPCISLFELVVHSVTLVLLNLLNPSSSSASSTLSYLLLFRLPSLAESSIMVLLSEIKQHREKSSPAKYWVDPDSVEEDVLIYTLDEKHGKTKVLQGQQLPGKWRVETAKVRIGSNPFNVALPGATRVPYTVLDVHGDLQRIISEYQSRYSLLNFATPGHGHGTPGSSSSSNNHQTKDALFGDDDEYEDNNHIIDDGGYNGLFMAKQYRDIVGSSSGGGEHFKTVMVHHRAQSLAKEFNMIAPMGSRFIEFVPAVVMQRSAKQCTSSPASSASPLKSSPNSSTIIQGSNFFQVEPYLGSRFRKFSRNAAMASLLWSGKGHETPNAFSHWTYAKTFGQELVCDAQGVGAESDPMGRRYRLTDPFILSRLPMEEYPRPYIGISAMRAFFSTHVCGPTCIALGLKHPFPEALEGALAEAHVGDQLFSLRSSLALLMKTAIFSPNGNKAHQKRRVSSPSPSPIKGNLASSLEEAVSENVKESVVQPEHDYLEGAVHYLDSHMQFGAMNLATQAETLLRHDNSNSTNELTASSSRDSLGDGAQ